MDRREALKMVGVLLGGVVSPSIASGLLSGCRAERAAEYAPVALSPAQYDLVGTLSDLIIPKTDTPGAREAGVPAFIDQILAKAFTEAERNRFLAGLADLDAFSQREGGKTFLELLPEDQTAHINQHLMAAKAARQTTQPEEQPFFYTLKELTLVGYYTSEVGATKELQWVHAAGTYDGDLPLSQAGRAYA